MASPSMICLVTGASGFIASTLVKQLCERGFQVRGTVRSLADSEKVKHLEGLCPQNPVKLFEADLLKDGSFAEACAGVDVVFHTASPFFMSGFTDAQKELIEPALNGTKNVLGSAIAAGVKKIVLTSSVAAVADAKNQQPPEGKVFDEADWNEVSTIDNNPYPLSKTVAERAAWEMVEAAAGIKLVVINPAFVIGPVLSKRTDATSVRMVKALLEGTLPAMGAAFGIVDVRDVAKAHIEAALRDKASGRYIVSTEDSYGVLDWAEMLREKFGNYPLPTECPAPAFRMKRSVAKARTELGIDFIEPKQSFIDMAGSLLRFEIVAKK